MQEVTTVLLTTFGIYLLIFGCYVVLKGDGIKVLVQSYQQTPALLAFAAAMLILLGAALLQVHWRWGSARESLASGLVVLTFVKGIGLLFIPNHFIGLSERMFSNQLTTKALGVGMAIIGISLVIMCF